jgi:small subunit ribosomal protein S4
MVTVKESERSKKLVRAWLEELGEPHVQNWLKVEIPKLEGQMIAMPTRDDIQIPVEENLIVELCSR